MSKKKRKISPITILNLRGTFTVVAICLWIMFCLLFCFEKYGFIPEDEIHLEQTLKWIMLGFAIGFAVAGLITFFIGNDQFDDEKIRQLYEKEKDKTFYED